MRRFIACWLLTSALVFPLAAQILPQTGDNDVDELLETTLPMTFVGGNGRISLGFNQDGDSQGELLGVFANDGRRAFIAQGWWDEHGAGGVQGDYNWIWGARARTSPLPDEPTVARVSFAVDQNAFDDRKASLGFGIERKDYFAHAYISGGISDARVAGSLSEIVEQSFGGVDETGEYVELETSTLITHIEVEPYGLSVGARLGQFSERLAMRYYIGADIDRGSGSARQRRASVGIDKYIGRRGFSLGAQAEHLERKDAIDGSESDQRYSLLLRYDFGGRGAFVPSASVEGPAWVARALRAPSAGHIRTVEVYRRRGAQTTQTVRGPRQYVNLAPMAVDDALEVPRDSTDNEVRVLANDIDPEGGTLRLVGVGSPQHGTARISGNVVLYTPEPGYSGVDGFDYQASDSGGLVSSARVRVNVLAANGAPVAMDDEAATVSGSSVDIDVLANDIDPDGDALRLIAVETPQVGSVVSGSTLRYSAPAGFVGTVRFRYTIADAAGLEASAEVTVLVGAGNRPPVAVDDTASTGPDQSVNVSVLANDSDPDGDPLVLLAVGTPQNGVASIVADRILYQPSPGFSGTDRFDYTIGDGRGGQASARVTISVADSNRPPDATDDFAETTGVAPVWIDVLQNDSDPDGDPLRLLNATVPADGSIRIVGRRIEFTANAGFTGTSRFFYTVADPAGLTDTAGVSVRVLASNRPPIAVADSAVTASGVAVDIPVLGNDSDPDGDALTVVSAEGAAFGSVGVLPDGRVRYQPASGFVGTDSFSYSISDGNLQASAEVVVTVGSGNLAPVAVADVATTTSGVAIDVPVLANDSDPDGDVLIVVSASGGTFGTTSVLPGGSVRYTPSGTFQGVDRFSYTISDGSLQASAEVVVTVDGVNQPPIAIGDDVVLIGLPLGGFAPAEIDVLANDSDPDGDPLTIVAISAPADGFAELLPDGRIRYTHTGDDGFDDFTYTISDGRGGLASATVNVTD